MYDYGLGTRPNRRRAFEHYLKAAEAGNPNSEYQVGIYYCAGFGVQKNYGVAVKWLRRAVDHGDAYAMHVLGKCQNLLVQSDRLRLAPSHARLGCSKQLLAPVGALASCSARIYRNAWYSVAPYADLSGT